MYGFIVKHGFHSIDAFSCRLISIKMNKRSEKDKTETKSVRKVMRRANNVNHKIIAHKIHSSEWTNPWSMHTWIDISTKLNSMRTSMEFQTIHPRKLKHTHTHCIYSMPRGQRRRRHHCHCHCHRTTKGCNTRFSSRENESIL